MSLERLKTLQTKIQETQALLKINDLKQKMEQLSAEMNAPGFWNNQENAQTISADYQDIKTEVEKWLELEKKTADLLELAEHNDDSLSEEIDKQTTELEKVFKDYEFYLLLNGPYDKSNAVIAHVYTTA
jgi:peptide chain release factor 2